MAQDTLGLPPGAFAKLHTEDDEVFYSQRGRVPHR